MPRFHPFVRLVIFSVGTIMAMVLAGALIYAGSLLPISAAVENAPTQMMVATMFCYPLIVLWMWFCRRVVDVRSFVSLGLRRHHAVRDCTFGVLCGAAAIAFLSGVLLLTGHIHLGASTGQIWSAETLEFGATAIGGRLWLWALFFVAVGVVEELIFRGYALHNLVAWLGVAGATIGQALVFALIHMQNVAPQVDGEQSTAMYDALRAIPGLFLIAVFFALCYLKTGSLWFPIGFHAAWDFCLGCIFSLPVSGIPVTRLLDVSVEGNTWITGGAFGPEGSVLLLPIIAAMSYLLLRQPNHPQAELDLALLDSPESIEEEQEDEPHTPRFKTTMRSQTQTLQPEVVNTLRQLSEAKAARRQESLIVAAADPGPTNGVLQTGLSAGPSDAPVLSTTLPTGKKTTAAQSQSSNSSASTPAPPDAGDHLVDAPDHLIDVPEVTGKTEPAPPSPPITEPAPTPSPQPQPAQTRKPPPPRW